MKRLVFCFDGTWNKLSADTPTNVVLTAASIVRQTNSGISQVIHYDEGVGTGRLERLLGGMMGAGLTQNIREAYRFLIFNYDPGDEVFVFGFSRGAFSAQTFIGFMRHVGVLRRLHAARIDEALEIYEKRSSRTSEVDVSVRAFRAKYSDSVCVDASDDLWRCENISGYESGHAPLLKIKYIGIWDTVEALGVPKFLPGSSWINRAHAFHEAKMSEFVESARHAVAIDEHRSLFPVTLWGDLTELNATKGKKPGDHDAPYQEKWFPGNHGSVGGGGDIRGLSDGALAWVLKGAKKAGLVLDTDAGSRIHGFNPDSLVPLVNVANAKKGMMDRLSTNRLGPDHEWQLSAAAIRRWHTDSGSLPDNKNYRPKTLEKVAPTLEAAKPLVQRGVGVMATHVVVSGDQLGKLARHYYGDASKWPVIFEANRDLIDDFDEIFPGWKLRIPALPIEGPAT
jgi:uncharacterized protein (DUF2235 family)